MRGQLNIRFLLVVTAGLTVFAVSWFFLHRYQKNRKLGEYLAQATRAEEEKKDDRAVRLLRSYVLSAPDDVAAKVRYGGLLDRLAKTARARSDALNVFEQVLKQEPDRHDTRQRAAELALALGRVDVALAHAEAVLAARPADPAVLLLAGTCLDQKKRYEEAAKAFDESRKAAPRPEAFVRLALVYRDRLSKREEAEQVMADLVAALPESDEAHFARAVYLQTTHARVMDEAVRETDPAAADELREEVAEYRVQAREALARARKIAPDRAELLLASASLAADFARDEEDEDERAAYLDEARGYLKPVLDKEPKAPAGYLLLAQVEVQSGKREEAVRVLKQARAQVPEAARTDVLFTLADLCLDAGDTAGADDVLAELKKHRQDLARIDLLRGRSLAAQGKWHEAAAALERARPLLTNLPAALARTDLLLAACYGQFGDTDRQLAAYQRAVASAPLDTRARAGVAAALAALGRTDEAISEYRKLTRMKESPVGAWLALARLEVYRNLTRPEADRRWADVTALLDLVEQVVPDAAAVPLLRAEVLAARGDRAAAKKLLTEQNQKRPKEGEFWFALATLADRDGDNKAARALLDKAAEQLGDTVDLRLARLRLTRYESAAQAAAVLEQTARGNESFGPDDRARLLRGVADTYRQIDNLAEAARLWRVVADLRPTELYVRFLLFDAALRANDEAGMQKALDEVNRIEGDGPLHKYGQAAVLTWRAARGDRAGLPGARALLATVAARRPAWSRVPLALARVEELDGNPEAAFEAYRQAVELGDRQTTVVRRLVQLLYERQRYAEADDVLRRLQAQAPISGDLQRLAAEVSVNVDHDRAVMLARKVVAPDAKDYRERLWLGQLLAAAGHRAEAGKEFEAAADLAGDQPDPWVALVVHHARGKDTAAAEAVIKRAAAKLGTGEAAQLALARCYEVVGRKDEAEARYQAAAKANPKSAAVVRAAAEFYQRAGDAKRAEPLLRALLAADLKAPAADAAWARRNLALALGLRPDEPSFAEAIALLDENARAGETPDDLRTRAVVIATRITRRKEAVALLEKAEKLRPPGPQHDFLLARLYEADGQWPKARDRMIRLVARHPSDTTYLAALARGLLAHGEWTEAQVWVARLRDLAPHGYAATALQVRLWTLRGGRPADSVALVREYAGATDGDPADPADRALAAADLLDEVSLAGVGDADAARAAEQHYTRFRDLSKRPDAVLPLAAHHGRHNDPDRAFALCEDALRRGCPVEQVAAVAGVAATGDAAKDTHFRKLEGWLTEAVAKYPQADVLRFQLATLRERQGRYPEAEAAYREILAKNPRHTGVLNNLAILLALTGRAAEAAPLAQRAVESVPAAGGGLLDTRAVVAAAARQYDAARADLEAVTANDKGDAATYYHLALVYTKLNDKARAGAAFHQARAKGFRLTLLHPLERPGYEELVAYVGKP